MEPAGTIALSEENHNAELAISDLNKCLICQVHKFPKKKYPLTQGTATGISRILHCAGIRESCQDNPTQCSRIVNALREEGNRLVLWHRQCYSDFTNEGHIQRVLKRKSDNHDESEAVPSSKAARRSSTQPIDWAKCMFCQTDSKKEALNQVLTFQTSQKLLEQALLDKEMSCRFAGISDSIAAEGKYHLKCYSRFQRKMQAAKNDEEGDASVRCFEEVMRLLDKQLSEGHIYSLKAVWTYYSQVLEEKNLQPGEYRGNRFKERIQNFLRGRVSFVPPLNPAEPSLIVSSNLSEAALRLLVKEPDVHSYSQPCDTKGLNNDAIEGIDMDTELLSWLYRVAIKLHHDLKSAPTHSCIGNITKENAEEIVPDSLYILISLLCNGQPEENEETTEDNMKTRILSICQDIIFLSSGNRKLTPKHIGLGLTIHQATRSKELVQLLHSAGHCVSYDTVLRMDNTIANDVLQRYRENGNVFVPSNFTENSDTKYTRYAVDNIDINEETLSGMGTFHATQVAAFRRKKERHQWLFKLLPNPTDSWIYRFHRSCMR